MYLGPVGTWCAMVCHGVQVLRAVYGVVQLAGVRPYATVGQYSSVDHRMMGFMLEVELGHGGSQPDCVADGVSSGWPCYVE